MKLGDFVAFAVRTQNKNCGHVKKWPPLEMNTTRGLRLYTGKIINSQIKISCPHISFWGSHVVVMITFIVIIRCLRPKQLKNYLCLCIHPINPLWLPQRHLPWESSLISFMSFLWRLWGCWEMLDSARSHGHRLPQRQGSIEKMCRSSVTFNSQ